MPTSAHLTAVLRVGASVAVLVGLHAALAVTALAQGLPEGNPIVPPQEVHVTNTTVLQVPPMDPQAVSDASAIANQSFIVNTVQPVPVEWVNALCALPNIYTTTPGNITYQNPDLASLNDLMQKASFVLIALAVTGVGVAAMFGADVHERLGRVLLGAVMSIGNMLWWEWGIKLNNALTAAISAPDVCATLIKPHIQLQAPDPGAAVAAPVLVIVYAFVSLLLLGTLLFRIGAIDVFIAAGSLFEMCWADEHVEHLARWYQRMSIGTVFGQVLLAIGLSAGKAMSSLGNGLAGALIAIAILLICRKLLGALSAQPVQNGGSSTGLALAMIARRLIFKVL